MKIERLNNNADARMAAHIKHRLGSETLRATTRLMPTEMLMHVPNNAHGHKTNNRHTYIRGNFLAQTSTCI